MTVSAHIDNLISKMRDYGSEFAGTYANHAPMVLVALDRLGGSAERLDDFFAHYDRTKCLFAFRSSIETVTEQTWRESMGKRDHESQLRRFFDAEVARLGVAAAVSLYLPHLAPGIGASALHALMRLAYGLVRQDAHEVAAALAYWAACFLPMPSTAGAGDTDDPLQIYARVCQLPELRRLPRHELLWQNMRESGGCAAFAPVGRWLLVSDATPRQLAAAALALFAATQDFCALHAVTGMHWLRIVLPHCRDPEPLLRGFWQCVMGLAGEMGFPELPSPDDLERWRKLPVPNWLEIRAAAAQSYDEHDFSLVFSAGEEMAHYGDPLYQLAAARRVGLVPDFR